MRRLIFILAVAAMLVVRNVFATTANDIPCQSSSPAPGPCVLNRSFTVTSGSVLDFGARGLTLTSAGTLDARGGNMKILAGSLVLQPGALLTSAAGSIEVNTTGAIEVQAASSKAKVDVSGTSGGDVLLVAGGDLTVAGQILADATLATSDGGTIDITGANVSITSTGKLSAMGGGSGTGGDITIISSTGNTTVGGTVDASSSLDGGSIEIDANTNLTTTSTAILNAKAGAGGVGDSIDLTAFDGNGTLDGTISGSASGDTINGGGSGADFSLDTNGPISRSASIDVSGGGLDGTSGNVDFSTFGDITITGAIDASAAGSAGFGGAVSFNTTQGIVDLRADILANGPGFGGDISAFSFEDVRVSAKLTSDGPNAGIELTGCNISVSGTAKLSAVGTGGQNTLQESSTLATGSTINGPLAAGVNRIEFRSFAPVITSPPSPAPVLVPNANLFPCGGPPPTTTTTSTTRVTTTSTSTTVHTTTTTSTTIPVGKPTTTTIAPTTTTATAAPPTTTTTNPAITTTTASTSTTTVPPTTTTGAASTTTTTTASASTSTTATSPPTTTTTVSPTTTTTPPAACSPSDCDDGDACTDDRCDPSSGCVNTPRTGFDAITCELDTIQNMLVVTPVAKVGGENLRARFLAKLMRAHKHADAARALTGGRLQSKIRRIERMVAAFVRGVTRGQARGKIDPAVAGQLLDLAQRAEMALRAMIP